MTMSQRKDERKNSPFQSNISRSLDGGVTSRKAAERRPLMDLVIEHTLVQGNCKTLKFYFKFRNFSCKINKKLEPYLHRLNSLI